MLNTKEFITSIRQIAEEKGISEDRIVETIEAAIAAAYKKDYGEKGQIIKAKLNQETGGIKVWQVKIVIEGVDEEGYVVGELPKFDENIEPQSKNEKVKKEEDSDSNKKEDKDGKNEEEEEEDLRIKFNPEKYITLEDAKKTDKKLKIGDEVVTELETKTEFGRIAAQTAKQVIIQRLREAEREVVFKEFKNLEGEVVSGVVQRTEGRTVFVDLGKTNGILPAIEQVFSDNYRIGQRLKFLVLRVEETNRGPSIFLSRSHPRLVLKLFEFEVPEIEAGNVEIKSVAREAGSRSKVAVLSNEENVDPIGSLVGQKGVRVQTVINELNGEKIDIIEWREDPVKYIANSLAPAKVVGVKILDDESKHALVEVSDDQFSLAIGKKGQNVRLAAKLTGWKIDVRSPKEEITAEEAEKIVEEGKNSPEKKAENKEEEKSSADLEPSLKEGLYQEVEESVKNKNNDK
ncbi:MAG: transcription termination/antitermination protein NusA [Candidatus Yanofskybacteria bacterium CG10_big_fil_rev_8_21_14_0_10_36_16]|uniref:Transcription termination/antitermination protein NusA n=1 Tax=Candidatus Yanofskybacteria bacterium CG10_big_fil_rev_8_21_14_0_10_36_16 TaxID=1975096 RepID=A0A2J0Q6K1_9BACT|nr:MAG: transcription termination/antitermination protein NusA [Candidatus Yanofskybacteria bacterium CG10_big_fil_rev_8_21_14_0_10_36_16]